MARYYGDELGNSLPPDLELTDAAAATSAASTSKDSYTKTIRMALVKNKKYRFWFTYKYEDPETKEISFSDASPIWQETFDIPNLTKAVKNLTLTRGFKSYGVKFDLDPLSVQEDVVIFESLTSDFATQSIVYTGTSTNVTIQASSYAPRWVKVRSRDRWDDLNISEATAGPVTPLNSEVDTFVVPGAPTNVLVTAFNETSDPSNYTGYINASWTAPATGAKGYNVGVWESTPGATLPSREVRVDGTSSKVDGLFVGKTYWIQVKSLSEFSTPSAWVPPALNYPVVIPGNTAVPGVVTISGTAAPKSIVFTWSDPASNAALVTSGGYYQVKLYTNGAGTGDPLETRKAWSNQSSFSGLTTGTQYWATVQPYTSGSTPVAGTITAIYGPLVPTAIDNPDLKGDFILANNQLQVGGTSNANDIHLSAYTKAVPPINTPGSLPTYGRIYIGGPETSTSVAVGLYNDSGTPFYADNYGRFSLGDKLTWSGNLATPVLDVKGTVEVTGPSTFSSYVLAGATDSAFIGIGKQVPYKISNALQSGPNGLTGIVINKSNTAVNSDYIKSDGTFRLGEGGLTYNGAGQLNLIGNIQAEGGTFTGNLRVTTGSIVAGGTWAADGTVSGARVVMQSGGLYAHDTTGAQSVFIQASDGLIDARKGYVGGWTLNATSQTEGYIQSSNTKIESSGNITLGNQVGSVYPIVRLSATDDFRLWVGSNSSSNAPFKVSKEGVLYAQGAVIGLGAGSTGPFASTSALNNYTLTSVTSGINSRLQDVEGAYVNVSTLNSSVATKNTTFVTADSTQPYANKAGDLWINGGDNNSIWTANGAGYNWTEKSNGKYATTTQLGTKLSAGGYAIAHTGGQITNITSNGIFITTGNFKIANTNDAAPSSGGYMLINSAGITAWDGTETTFAINSSGGNAAFKGNISGSTGSFTGTLVSGTDSTASGYINTGATKAVSGYGDVKYLQVKAIGLQSTSNSGWVSTIYPWLDNSYSLGTGSFSWNLLYLGGAAYFAGGTTIKIDASGYATFNRITLTGGYGVYSDWSPGPDNTHSLGQSTRRWADVWSVDTSINSSDLRYKKDILDSNLGLSFINNLRPISYKWKKAKTEVVLEETTEQRENTPGVKENVTVMLPKISGYDADGEEIIETTSSEGSRNHYGFIAQEVKEALDLSGVGDSFAGWVLDNKDNPESGQNLRYSEFIAPLTKAVQELSDMVELLQQEVNTLKGI